MEEEILKLRREANYLRYVEKDKEGALDAIMKLCDNGSWVLCTKTGFPNNQKRGARQTAFPPSLDIPIHCCYI